MLRKGIVKTTLPLNSHLFTRSRLFSSTPVRTQRGNLLRSKLMFAKKQSSDGTFID